MVQMVMSLPRRYKENALILLTFSPTLDVVQDADYKTKKTSGLQANPNVFISRAKGIGGKVLPIASGPNSLPVLALGKLWLLTRFAQADLFALNLTRITSHVTRLAQCATQ